MANKHGRPARPAIEDGEASGMLEAVDHHVAVGSIDDEVAAVEAQLEELGALYERTKKRESYTAAARLSVELRQLQDKLRQLREQRREQSLDDDAAAERELVKVLRALPASMRARVLSQVPEVLADTVH